MKKPYRKIRKNISEQEARDKLTIAMVQRQNCLEHLMAIRLGEVTPLICALTNQSLDDMIDECNAQIEWLDNRIEDLQRFIKDKPIITDLIG